MTQKKIRVHALEHAPAEGVARIGDWVQARGHFLTTTRLDLGQSLPRPEDFDLLIMMGGGMNIYQYRDFPWLRDERALMLAAVEDNKPVLGVCLGAQMLADVLGARVHQNQVKEIGWYPVRFVERPEAFAAFEETATVFHWHGDTFELPPGAQRIAESEACSNQAFMHGDRLIGLQFHVEIEPQTVSNFVCGGESELVAQPYVQTPDTILGNRVDLTAMHQGLEHLLDYLASRVR